MLGFEPQLFHFDIDSSQIPTPTDFEEELQAHQLQILMALRDENKALASRAASYSYHSRGRKIRQQRIPQPGDVDHSSSDFLIA